MLGDLLRRLREDGERAALTGRGVSRVAVGEALGVDHTTIYTIETGRRRPSPEMLAKLLQHYGATKEEEDEAARLLVFGGDSDPQPTAA